MTGKLILEDGSTFEGKTFGSRVSTAGEVVFSTGMVGYPESFTDPSYEGQILILTYPLIGNYGVPDKIYWESTKIHISGLVVSNYIGTPSHFQSIMTLSDWLQKENIPAIEISDTRLLTQKIRSQGAMLGKIIPPAGGDIPFYDPNVENLVAKVSTKSIIEEGNGKKTAILIDCGAKKNIKRCLLKRGLRVLTVPWDFDPFENLHLGGVQGHLRGDQMGSSEVNPFDAIVVSNGPGDPKMADKTILTMQKALKRNVPIFGLCLGHQLLTLAAGGNTGKLKFGHRSQNQPCLMVGSNRCFITTQNHGFEVNKIPNGFRPWFTNANDGSNEGIIHEKLPIMSVQFHPESYPGPQDTEWIFDFFLEKL